VEKYQRLAWRLSIILFVIVGAYLATAWAGGALRVPMPVANAGCSGCTGVWYGASSTYMSPAIQHVWPQTTSNACGVENAIGLVNYDDLVSGHGAAFTSLSAQGAVEAANQKSGQSQWGHATPTNQWGGITNIAPDLGTDPRSIAFMTWNYSVSNRFFHDYIYNWTMDTNGSQLSFTQQVANATTKVGVALEAWSEPVSVTINGGLHSVLVTGLWSGNDPATHYPAQIQGLVYRDPEGNYSSSRQEIDYSVWLNGHYYNQFGTYSLWSLYYGDRYKPGDQLNTGDPEPTVGPYKPGVKYRWHWFHGFTWIRRDTNSINGQWSPDWAYNAVTGAKL
jgi:hypothetical protein